MFILFPVVIFIFLGDTVNHKAKVHSPDYIVFVLHDNLLYLVYVNDDQ